MGAAECAQGACNRNRVCRSHRGQQYVERMLCNRCCPQYHWSAAHVERASFCVPTWTTGNIPRRPKIMQKHVMLLKLRTYLSLITPCGCFWCRVAGSAQPAGDRPSRMCCRGPRWQIQTVGHTSIFEPWQSEATCWTKGQWGSVRHCDGCDA